MLDDLRSLFHGQVELCNLRSNFQAVRIDRNRYDLCEREFPGSDELLLQKVRQFCAQVSRLVLLSESSWGG